jgi:hypothetical protein
MDVKRDLIDGDPLEYEGGLAGGDAQSIRQRVLVEARNQPVISRAWWPGSIVVAGAVAVCLLLAISIGIRMDVGRTSTPAAPVAVKEGPGRQMQFATAGGTRVIWTFHEELEL